MGHPSGGGAMPAPTTFHLRLAREMQEVDRSDPFTYSRTLCHLAGGVETDIKKLRDHIKRGYEARAAGQRRRDAEAAKIVPEIIKALGLTGNKRRRHRHPKARPADGSQHE